MKKLLCLIAMITLVSFSYGQGLTRPTAVVAKDWGDRTSGTLNSLISNLSAVDQTVIIDSGDWAITNTVSFPTNVTLRVERGSRFLVSSGINLEILGEFQAGNYQVFNGLGTASGDASFIYRWPDWGNTTRFDIGDGLLRGNADLTTFIMTTVTNMYYSESGIIMTTNDWSFLLRTNDLYRNGGTILEYTNSTDEGGFLLTTNDLYQNGGTIVETTDLDSLASDAQSYISRAYVEYNNATLVTIQTGEGYCTSNKFKMIVSTNIAVPSLYASSTGFAYVYMDNDSTFPGTPSFYTTVSTPELSVTYDQMVCSTNVLDRFIGAYAMTNGVPVPFHTSEHGSIAPEAVDCFNIAGNMNPTEVYQNPNINELSVACPVGTKRALLSARSEDTGNDCHATLALAENVTVGAYTGFEAKVVHGNGYDECAVLGWADLGASRNVKIKGENDDDNELSARIHAYKVKR